MRIAFSLIIGIILSLSGCSKKGETDNDTVIDSGNKSNLPVSLNLLIEHAEYCKAIYDAGGDQKDDVAFDVKQKNGTTIIIIRGTANESNVQSDVDIELVHDARTGIYLHKGFKDASTTIMQILDEQYTVEQTVHVTGHSLGGAVAQILGMWYHKRGNNVQIFSYGSPKVSSQVMSGGQPTHWRVVSRRDPIPFMPPWPYIHTGLFINSQTLDWGPDNNNGLISETDGLDHAIAKYVTTLKEQL